MEDVFQRQTKIARKAVVATFLFNAILLMRLNKEWPYFLGILVPLGILVAAHIWTSQKNRGYNALHYLALLIGMTTSYLGVQAVATHSLPYTWLFKGMDKNVVGFVTLFCFFVNLTYITIYQKGKLLLFSIPIGFVMIASLYIRYKEEVFMGMGIQLPILFGWVYMILGTTMYWNVRYTQEQRELVAKEYERIQVMTSQLEKTIDQLGENQRTADAVASSLQINIGETSMASTDIVTSVQQMKDSFYQQNTHVEESVKYLDTMNNQLEQVVSSSSLMNEQAEISSHVVQHAIQQLKQTRNFVEHMESLFAEHLQNTGLLYQNVKEVLSNVGAIQQVSGKIKILSLNASIESAKAGKAGAGFQVISEEIRKLSLMSEESLKKITETLSQIEAQTHHTVDRILSSQTPMKQTVEATSELRSAFEQVETVNGTVVAEVQGVHQLVQDLQSSVVRISEYMQVVADLSGENQSASLVLSDSLLVINKMVEKIAIDAKQLTHS